MRDNYFARIHNNFIMVNSHACADTGQAEEMVKEWLSLVVERDRLLREQLDMVRICT